MAHAEPEPIEPTEAKPVERPGPVAVRDDLPAGHWLRGRRAATVVWSGEVDQVEVAGRLVAVRDAAELAAVEKPVEEKPAAVARVR